MNYVIFKEESFLPKRTSLLRIVLSDKFLRGIILNGIRQGLKEFGGGRNLALALPETWENKLDTGKIPMYSYTGTIPLPLGPANNHKGDTHIISQGRYVAQTDKDWCRQILQQSQADVMFVNVNPELNAYREKIQFISNGQVAGFRRIYADSAQTMPMPDDWPHLVFIKNGHLIHEVLPLSFPEFVHACSHAKMNISILDVAGSVLDLESEKDFLSFCARQINLLPQIPQEYVIYSHKQYIPDYQNNISRQVRYFGNVIVSKNSCIEPNAILIGPSFLADQVKVKPGAVVQSSIIGPKVTVAKNQVIQNRVLLNSSPKTKSTSSAENNHRKLFLVNVAGSHNGENSRYKTWSKLDYAGGLKRFVDIVFSVMILILFAPVIPLLALAVKITSAGPVFYKARRQGKYGREFYCLKFRTMITGADDLQNRLRQISEVDGPQFKIEEDPRMTPIGKYLRDTYLDEIPQFFNVLMGHMSVIGPRPSPEKENSLCAYWRDFRLSVRPGITGLWQVRRTRTEGQDFQEWIYYDTKYVKHLSLKRDIGICGLTAIRMLKNFTRQF
jgi:lipopolysaccharide/colanic/teichoic acid biosynthesis glycosyltransferase